MSPSEAAKPDHQSGFTLSRGRFRRAMRAGDFTAVVRRFSSFRQLFLLAPLAPFGCRLRLRRSPSCGIFTPQAEMVFRRGQFRMDATKR
jgi:hypothetical protein